MIEKPDGWKNVLLNEVMVVIKEQISPNEIVKGTFYVGLENIESNTGIFIQNESEKTSLKSNKFKFYSEDILYGKLRPYLNKVWLANRSGICSTDLLPIRPNPKMVLREYLYYYLKSPFFVKQASTRVSGANLPRLSPKQLVKFQIPLPFRDGKPDLEKQRKIVAILEKAERMKELQGQVDGLLDEFLKSLFIDMFGDPVTNPMGWEKKSLDSFGKITTGNTPSRKNDEYFGNYLQWIKSDNINTPYTYLTQSDEGLSPVGAEVGRVVPSGSILITCIAGSQKCIGNVAIANREVAFNQQINAITPYIHVNLFYLYHLIKLSQKYIQDYSSKSMKGMISKGVLKKIEFISPPKSIQDDFGRIVSEVENVDQGIKSIDKDISLVFNSLLQKAFSGELKT